MAAKAFNLSASKYTNLSARNGVDSALSTLLEDIKSTERPVFPFSEGVFTASIPDVTVTIKGRKSSLEIFGEGETKEKALSQLFKNLLNPGSVVPKTFGPEKARLAVGPAGNPAAIVQITP